MSFVHHPHPHVKTRRPSKTVSEHHVGVNGRIALLVTGAVGTMWCAYIFAALALVALPGAVQGGLLTIITWISQTFIQLTLLSVIMVGQNVQAAASDARADLTYKDAEATFEEARQIQQHLAVQDRALERLTPKDGSEGVPS